MTTAETIAEMEKLFDRREKLMRRIVRENDRILRRNKALDGMPRATAGEPAPQRVGVALADIASKIKIIDEDLATWRRKIEGMIARVENEDFRDILTYRYVQWLPMWEVAIRMHYTRGYAYEKLVAAKKEIGCGEKS